MTPERVLNDIAAIARKVAQSNLWVARGLRQTDAPSNTMRVYARRAVCAGKVSEVRGLLQARMLRQTPLAPNLVKRALAVFDNEVERLGARVK